MRASSIVGRLSLTLVSLVGIAGCDESQPILPSDSDGIAAVRVTPSAAGLVPGESLRLEGTPIDVGNNPLDGLLVSWSTSDATIVEVSNDGELTAVRPGEATITGSSEGKSATSHITVTEGAFLGAEGGTMTALDGAVSLVVPSGALAAGTAIHVDRFNPPLPDATTTFAPFRIRFVGSLTTPATLTVNYDPASGPAGVSETDIGLRTLTLQGVSHSAGGTTDSATHTATVSVTAATLYDVGRIPPQTPCTAPEYRQFDFWLGRWNVAPTDAPPDARQALSLITAEAGGCAIFEDFRDLDVRGVSINVFDPVTAAWYETFVDNTGTRLVLRGAFAGNTMILTAPDGGSRITWSNLGGTVQQFGENSLDAGASWEPAFDLIYRP